MDKTLVFIDDGFLSKVSKFFGGGNHIKLHRKDFAESLCSKENLFCEKIFLYTAPPFQSHKPGKAEEKRKEGYDKFASSLVREGVVVREGRCRRLKIDGGYVYSQKGVDILLAIDLMKVVSDFRGVGKVILVASDSDFVPVIKELSSKGIKTVLYTYYDKKRDSPFSRSNHLIKSVSKYVKMVKEDFE